MTHLNRIITHDGEDIWFSHGEAAIWNTVPPAYPWQHPNTTPLEIGMNSATGQLWTPSESVPISVFAGSLPLPRSFLSYPMVVDPMPIQIRANSHNLAVAALQYLKNQLRSVSYRFPAKLAFQPDGASEVAYTDIYGVRFDVNPLFINDENGQGLLRCVMHLDRAPLFSNLGAANSLFDTTHTNMATLAYPTVQEGDLLYEGQPINIRITPDTFRESSFYVASCKTPISTTNGAASVTTGGFTTTTITNNNPWALNQRLRMRVLQRLSTTATAVVQLEVDGIGWSERFTINPNAVNPSSILLDFGDFPADILRIQDNGVREIIIRLHVISGSVSLVSTVLVPYYEWATVLDVNGRNGETLDVCIQSFREESMYASAQNKRPTLPLDADKAFIIKAGDEYVPVRIVGTVPRLYPNARLLVGWNKKNEFNPSDQIDLEATYAPLYLSFRGAQ